MIMLYVILLYMTSIILTMVLCHITNGIQPLVDTILRSDSYSFNNHLLSDLEIFELSFMPFFNIVISVLMLLILFVDFLMLLLSPHKIYAHIKQTIKDRKTIRAANACYFLKLSLYKLNIISYTYMPRLSISKLAEYLVENPKHR